MKRAACLALMLSACGGEVVSSQGRVTNIEIFEGPEDARNAGCRIVGPMAGTRLSNLALLSGGFNRALEPEDGNPARLVMLAETEQTADEIRWSLFDGRQRGAERYAAIALSGDFATTLDAGWVDAQAPQASFRLPALDDYMLDPPLSVARIEGPAEFTEEGLMFSGVIHGYLRMQHINEAIAKLYVRCEQPDQPAVCELAYSQLPDDPDEPTFTAYIRNFLGAPDTRLDGAVPSACIDEECNAYGICLGLDFSPQSFEIDL